MAVFLPKLHGYNFDLKYEQGKKISGTDALSWLDTEANQNVHDGIPLYFLQFINTSNMYHEYKHLAQNVTTPASIDSSNT